MLREPPPGPNSRSLVERLERVECQAFGHRREHRAQVGGAASRQPGDADMHPIVLASGKGSNLWDADGNRYVDLAAGFGAVLLGHGFPALTHAVQGQAERLCQGLGDVFAADLKVALLERLSALHPGTRPRVLLGQSGSDAVTAAIKTATLATRRPGVLAFDGAYHGLGYGPLSVCGYRVGFREPFGDQLNPHVRFAPYPGLRHASLDASLGFVEAELAAGDVAAVLVEPVLGRGGCVVPPEGFLTELCARAHAHGAVVIADEIWTGLGRAGSMVRSAELSAPVDILCLGKGLGGGLAMSACVATESLMAGWTSRQDVIHTSTHAGAPLPCAAAIATLDALRTKHLDERAQLVGHRVREALRQDLAGCPRVVEIRGVGLMIGIMLDSASTALATMSALLKRGYLVLTGGVGGEVLTLTPALTIDEALLLGFSRALREVLDQDIGEVPEAEPPTPRTV